MKTNINQHQLTEAILSKNQDFFVEIANQSAEGVSVSDEDGNYLYVNPAFCSMVGYSIEELLQMTVFDLKAKSQDKTSFSRTKSSKEGLPVQVYLLRKDGTEFFSEVLGKVIELEEGNIILGIVRDINDALNHDDERLNFERHAQSSQKLKSLEILAGGIAHDFNNLLMVILGNAELAALKLPENSSALVHLKEIELASHRAAELSQQMLAYSGKGKSVIVPISLSEAIQDLSQFIETSVSSNIIVKYNFEDDLPTFNGDISQIRQVIINLINNAKEAIGDDKGKITFTTSLKYCDREYLDSTHTVIGAIAEEPLEVGIYTYFEITDTGCGMDTNTIEKIFDPFFTTKFTGRGLGTSVVQGIVRGHNGVIKIDSQPEKGTTFRVLFRINQSVVQQVAQETSGEESNNKANQGEFSGTVLIIDDEKMVLNIGTKLLEHLGFNVLSASTGSEGVVLFEQNVDTIQCVFLDLIMPGMNGEQTFDNMQQINTDIPVVLCSGYNEVDATENITAKGLAGFIQKPYHLKALQQMAATIINQ